MEQQELEQAESGELALAKPWNSAGNLFLIAAGILIVGILTLSQLRGDSASALYAVDQPGTDADFGSLFEGSEARPAVVKFSANWCGPCRLMKPVFQEASLGKPENIRFVIVNVDKLEATAARFKVQGIPCFVVVDKGGKEVSRQTGMVKVEDLEAMAATAAGTASGT